MPAARPTRAAFPWGRLALYGAVHGALGALFLLAGPYAATAFPLDDAYIHHVYAEGVAFGEGFAYNPGAPANGATSPLWVLLLAPLRLLGLRGAALVLPTKLLGLALGALLALVADHLAAALGASPKARFAAGLLVAANPLVVYGAVSGMELPLASLLLLAALLAFARRRLLAAGLALGAGILARPELTLAWLFVAGLEGRRRRAPPPTALWLPGALVWAVWMGRSLHVADAWLPTTFAAKHDAAGLAQWVDVPWATLIALGGPLAIVTLPLGVLAIRRWWRRPSTARMAALALLVFLPLGVAWAHDIAEPTRFFWWRYGAPVLPLALVIAACGLDALPAPRRALAAGAALLLGLAFAWPAARDQAEHARNITELNVAAARWLEERVGEWDWLASNDAGAVRLLTERPVVDLIGLNDHRMRTAARAEVLEAADPRYYVVFESWFPNMVASPRFRVVRRFRSEPYVVCRECAQSELLILERVR